MLSPLGLGHPALAIAASRAGGIGVLDLELSAAPAFTQLQLLARHAGEQGFGVRLGAFDAELADRLGELLDAGLNLLILGREQWPEWQHWLADTRMDAATLLLELSDNEPLDSAIAGRLDGLLLKGHEAAGFVGESSSFILAQHWRATCELPLYLRGGITPHTAAAAALAGCAGVALDSQVLLLQESPVVAELQPHLRSLSGSETLAAGNGEHGRYCRILVRPGFARARTFVADAEALTPTQMRERLLAEVEWRNPPAGLLPLGQDVAFAATWQKQFGSVAQLFQAIDAAVQHNPQIALSARALRGERAPFAEALGLNLPLVQGPMSRVSDKAEFAAAVAEGGALPMLALALLKGKPLAALLAKTAELLAGRPWGIGLLGFAPQTLLDEQIAAAKPHRPSYAIIAGGRPDQAVRLEQSGIPSFLHVPSSNLIPMFLKEGARRFIFEGRECGGHVGPLSSFVLWSSMIDRLLEEIALGVPADEIQVLFAGGIHDARSSAMVQAMAAPLLAKGVKVGLLMGSAYLFTREIVEAGAIVETFQQQAIDCARTVNLESGTGHASRCAYTPFAAAFFARRNELRQQAVPADEAREQLDDLILGRLRLASKGSMRVGEEGAIREFGASEQVADGMYMIGQVATLRDAVTDIAGLHRAVTEDSLVLLEEYQQTQLETAVEPGQPADIAIIGMGSILPGSNTTREYWQNILAKVDAITEIPAHRWDWRLYFDEDRTTPDKIYSRWGGFLDDLVFDPTRYGMPPKSIESVDPMQLMALDIARQTLADAGYEQRGFNREKASVIIGASGGAGDVGMQYGLRSELPRFKGDLPGEIAGRLPQWTEDTFAGILINVMAGRIANRLDFGGVNFATDAACASSLAAVYQGINELLSGRSDLVIAGGVDTVQGPFGYLCFSKTQALSPRGRCRTFDASADGIVISEGIAMVALKRLSDAERDGDRVYAVIKGMAGSSDGKAKGLTAPLPAGQLRAMRRAYQQAGFGPDSVGLFEAHGTGTVAGDTAELDSTTSLLREVGSRPAQAVVGSVKTMIGHTKATAGVAGMIKAALALHHKVLPPHLGVQSPNPVLKKDDSPLCVLDEAQPWLAAAQQPRRAAVSAFGFGGTNFHAVLEEYAGEYRPWLEQSVSDAWSAELLLWRAGTREQLQDQLSQLQAQLAAPGKVALRDIACYLSDNLGQGEHSLALVVGSLDELADKLAKAQRRLAGDEMIDPSIVLGDSRVEPGQVALLFPGQGSQNIYMLRELAVLFPSVADTLAEADALLAGGTERFASKPLSQFIHPRACYDEASRQAASAALTSTDVAQPALGAVEAGLLRLLRELGIDGDMLAGHSYGEFVALFAAGQIDFAGLMGLSEARGRFIVEAAASAGSELGSMAMVQAPRARVEQAIAAIPQLLVANHNAPEQSIISGSSAGIAQALDVLQQAGINASPIPVAAAFHSPFVAPAQGLLAAAIAATPWQAGHLPVYSNASAALHAGEPAAVQQAMAEHLVKPVEFVAQIEAMYAAGARVFIEVGPKAVLSRLVGRILDGKPHQAVALDERGGGLVSLLLALARLHVLGVAFQPQRLFAGRACQASTNGRLDGLWRDASLPKQAWLLNGSGARRASEAPRQIGVRQGEVLSAVEPAIAAHPVVVPLNRNPATPTHSAVRHKERLVMSEPTAIHGDEMSSVMAEYFATMRQFLETQERVLNAFMAGGAQPAAMPRSLPAAPAPRRPVAAAPVARVAPAAVPVAAPAPVPATVAAPVAAAPVATPAPAVAPEAKAGKPKIKDLLLSIVEERTGYPSDMVGLEQNLEADLGIDSIKRVEIVGALLQTLPPAYGSALGEARSQLNTRATLADMLKMLEGLEVGEVAVPFESAGASPKTVPVAASHSPRHIVVPEEEAIPEQAARRFEPGYFILTADDHGLALRLQEWLEQRGCSVSLLSRGLLADETALDAWCRETAANPGKQVAGVIHLAALGAQALSADAALEAWQRELLVNEKSLYLILHALAAQLRGDAHVVALSGLGGLFARGVDEQRHALSLQGGSSGLIKSIREERPALRTRAIDLDPALSDAEQLAIITTELQVVGGRQEVGYPAGRRTVFRTQADEVVAEDLLPPVDNAVVLATGGARGITAEVLREIARPGNVLVLTGRSPLADEDVATAGLRDERQLRQHFIGEVRAGRLAMTPAEMQKRTAALIGLREMHGNIADLRARGATVEYLAVDTTDEAALAAAIDGIRQRHGKLSGVVHGAGVIEDKLLEDKTPDSWMRVVGTKVLGMLLLHKLVRVEELEFFAVFSSVAGRYGNSGQLDYATANELMSRLCCQLQRLWGDKTKLLSLNWGPWGPTLFGAGMVTAETEKKFADKGVALVGAAQGRRLFDEALRLKAGHAVEVVAGDGPWERHEEQVGRWQEETGAAPPTARQPLLTQCRIEDGEKGTQILHFILDASHGYLQEHCIDGVPVLPAAVALEIIAEAATLMWPGWIVAEVADLRLLKGVQLSEPTQALSLLTNPPTYASSEGFDASISIRSGSGKQQRMHYRAAVKMAQQLPEAPRHVPSEYHGRELPVAKAYQEWLFHGPRFQVIRGIRGLSSQGAAALMCPSSPQQWLAGGRVEQQWIIDPAVLDAAPQMALLWARTFHDGSALPAQFGRVIRYVEQLPERFHMDFQCLPGEAQQVRANVFFSDDEGRLLLLIEDLQCIVDARLNRLGGTHLRKETE
ncbi:type I polyketide synthase [Pseudomonas subflava]|uniref:type I polyketide synthase n=1 Tax=Pseudomonas subflava TaxID=2952933 RepID=UPI0020795811|nr:type I polyketide synthase [Pseudomonas subflava]